MPFGDKLDLKRNVVRFDDIYARIIEAAARDAGLEPIRCDMLEESGFIHRKMLEQIRDAAVAIVDISLLNANVFYELGVRHTLRKAVTILIRRKGTNVPFNIANLNVIEYDETKPRGIADTKRRISTFIKNGLQTKKIDNLVQEILQPSITLGAKPIGRQRTTKFRLRGRKSRICVITGDLQNVHGKDVWVNAENTNMQMARFYDWAVSSVIRYYGAVRDATGHVQDDVIAKELAKKMKGKGSVPPATVIPTGPGELRASHEVKAIFHAAAVEGEIGEGYRPIANLGKCITNALALFDSPQFRAQRLRTILFCLLGAGVAPPQDVDCIVRTLVEGALSYLDAHPDTAAEEIYFLAYKEAELDICMSVLSSYPELSRA